MSAVHMFLRPYKCTICGNRFKVASALKTHIACVHEGEKNYSCSYCDATFSAKYCLINTIYVFELLNFCTKSDQKSRFFNHYVNSTNYSKDRNLS